MGLLRPARLIAGTELRRRLRDRTFVIQGVLAPLLLASIISLAVGGISDDLDLRIGVVDADHSPLSAGVVDALAAVSEAGLRFPAVADADAAREQVDREDLGAAIVLPDGLQASVVGGRPEPLEVLADAEQQIAGDVALAVAEGIAARIGSGRLAVLTALEAAPPGGGPGVDELTAAAGAVELPLELQEGPVGGRFDPAAYFGPAMGILFLFFTVGAGARSLLTEKHEGTLVRLRAGPIPTAAILLGKSAAVVVVGLVSLLVLYAVTSLLYGADWGDPAGVLALVVAIVLAIGGVASVIAALARTEASADGYTAMAAFVFALLGGNFITPGDVPDVLRSIAKVTPNGWALQGFTELSAGKGDIGDVVVHVAVLLAIAAVTASAGMLLLRRRVLT